MAKPIITGCSAHPTITPGESGETVTIWGDYLLAEGSEDGLHTPKITCNPEDGVTFSVTPENLQSSTDVSLEATIELNPLSTRNGMRELIVKSAAHICAGQLCDAFEVVDATEPPDDADDPLQSTKQE